MAQQGSYAELSQDPDSAFTKLMEWQMSGGETKGGEQQGAEDDGREDAGVKDAIGGYEDVIEGLAEEGEGEGEEDEEVLKAKRGDEPGPAAVADKSQKG